MDTAVDAPVEERVFQRAQRLLAVQHAVAEITGGRKVETDPVALKNAVLQIRTAVQSIPGAYCVFIGGLAVQEHGYVRWTDDVDVVVDAEHFETLNTFCPRNRIGSIRVDIFRDCSKSKKFPRGSPSVHNLGCNNEFADLSGLVHLKISSGKYQDLADIVELLKRHPLEEATIRAALPESMKPEFERLAQQARRELE